MSICPRLPSALTVALTLGLTLYIGACASAERYDSDTKATTINQISSAGQLSATEGDTEGSSTGEGSSSGGGDATGSLTSGPSSTSTSTSTSTTSTTTNPATTDAPCGGLCDQPPATGCYDDIGECSDGTCLYYPFDEGTPCDDNDPCTKGDACDGNGVCAGADPVDCTPPANASGGKCVDGECTGFKCTAPYENCDGDWDNGCEVPTGVANQCDQDGLNPDGGCWTAYCGALDDPKATNFGTYYCFDCSTCTEMGGGTVSWCNHSTGNWYPAELGACGSWLDLVCGP
ncbi:MAG: hypothetical protein H6710_10820 [Myxococcales bacterium]|nr:hypothetical protein [Myxococcales bacterium]MCB9702500.1 hypothetical protein [Myxococcales bacterium]